MNGMKGVCSISRKKLIKGLIAVPIAVLALLYGSGYLSQLLYNYERWQAAGGVYGTAPDFPDPNFFLCLAAALHLPYGLYGPVSYTHLTLPTTLGCSGRGGAGP